MNQRMDTQQSVIEFLKEKHHPQAILLHGSRAIGQERPHSDWDIIMLFKDKPTEKGGRADIEGKDVEWRNIKLPITNEEIISIFDVYLQFAKVLWEEENHGTDLLERAKVVYAKGTNLTVDELTMTKQFFNHKIEGMKDDIDNPHLFFRHLSVLYIRAVNYWFEVLQNEYSKPLYLAIPIIEEKDSEYSNLLEVLVSTASAQEKIKVGQQISNRLFK